MGQSMKIIKPPATWPRPRTRSVFPCALAIQSSHGLDGQNGGESPDWQLRKSANGEEHRAGDLFPWCSSNHEAISPRGGCVDGMGHCDSNAADTVSPESSDMMSR